MASKLLDWLKNRIEKFDRSWKNRKVYDSWKNLLYVLDLCRFSIMSWLMVLAGWLLLYSTQGQDMLLGIAGAPAKNWFWFLGSLVIWAWSAWFFARIMLNFEFDRKMAPQDPLEVKNKTESATAGSSLQAGETEDPPEVKNKTESAPHWSMDSLRREIPWVLLALAFCITGLNLFKAGSGIDQDLRNRVFLLAWIPFGFGVGVVLFRLVWVRCNGRKYLPYRARRLVPELRKTDDLIKCECKLTPNQRKLFWISIVLSACLLVVLSLLPYSSVKKYFLVLLFLVLAIAFIIRFLKQLWITDKLGPLTRWIIYILIMLAISLGILSTLYPLSVSSLFSKSPISLFMIWAATMTAFGSGIVYWSNHSRFPILTFLFIWAVGISYINDNHNLRQAEEVQPIDTRPKVDDATKAWLTAQRTGDANAWSRLVAQKQVDDPPVPVVVVATAGGGIRAAYWTVTVLGRLNQIDGFDRHLFAISGVSGGSVGAAVYRAVLADLEEGQRPSCADVKGVNHAIELCAQKVLEGDLLVPIMAGTLYPDLIQRFWPFGEWSHGVSFPDRQSALEKGFEAAYKDVMGNDRFARSLLTLYPKQQQDGKESWPALLLNATWVSMGRRMVASNLDLSNTDAGSNNLITVYDQLGCIGRDLRLSTAAGNSARFPGLSPAGTLRVPASCDLRLRDAPDSNAEDEIIRQFKEEFESKKKECAVLIVRATSHSEKWTLAGFDDAGEFRKVVIDGPNHDLSKELKKEPINKSRVIELATSRLGRTRPAGTNCWLTAEQETPLKPGNVFGHLLDGGYFENFGAKTAQEVLSVLIAEAKNKVSIRPIVIQISSDPSLPDDFEQIADPDPVSFGYEIRQPLLAAFATRSAHGILAARELRQYTESLGQGECDLHLGDASEGNPEDEIIRQFKMEFASKKKECAVLIVRATNQPEKWTLAGFDDAGEFCTVVIDDPDHDLPKELKKKPINKSRIIELATSSLDRTPIDCDQDRGIFLHFNMIHEKGVVDPPLGWMLSDVAQLRIKSYLDEGYDLRLMSVDTADGLVNEGRNLVIVALVGTNLHIRIFDANGERVVDKAENKLTSGETLMSLKEQLNPLPEKCGLSPEQKQKIIRDAISIAGYNLAEDGSMREQLKAYDSKFEEWFETDRYRKGYERNLNNLRIIEKVFACYKTVKK